VEHERVERIGRNEAVFREVNESIRGVAPQDPMFDALCECGSESCTGQFAISVDEYEHVRSDPALFVILPGHDVPDVEEVVEDEGVFVVIRKRPGGPERLARETSPR
jgi:hypothetical protein